MKKKDVNILVYMKNNFHEILLKKEIQSRLEDCKVFSVQSKADSIKILLTEKVHALVVDIKSGVREELLDIHQIHLCSPQMPIVAVIDQNVGNIDLKLVAIGVKEIIEKHETFYIDVPKILSKIIIRHHIRPQEVDTIEGYIKESEHLKITSLTLSHEINNPLQAILGLSELILDDKSQYDNNLVEKIEAIQKSALRIQQSTHRLSNITSPAYQKTPNGVIIDPQKSQIRSKSKVKLTETE